MPGQTAEAIASAMREELGELLGDEIMREIVAASRTSWIAQLLAGLAI